MLKGAVLEIVVLATAEENFDANILYKSCGLVKFSMQSILMVTRSLVKKQENRRNSTEILPFFFNMKVKFLRDSPSFSISFQC